MGGVSGLPGPTDAWATLAGLAVETSRIRLGTLMTAATFRLPGPLAITVAQVDQMSGGRVELGLGAGWFEAEHTAYGDPVPAAGGALRHAGGAARPSSPGCGTRPRARRSPSTARTTSCRTRPRCRSPRSGRARRCCWAARVPAARPGWRPGSRTSSTRGSGRCRIRRPAFARVREACEAAGRDPASMTYSVAHTVCCGKDEAEFRRRAAAIGREPARGPRARPRRHARGGRGQDRGVRRDRRGARLPAGIRPGRPGPPGPDRRRTSLPQV